MSIEQGGVERYDFSEEQINLLVNNSRLFHAKFAQEVSLVDLRMEDFGGSTTAVLSSNMPHFKSDNRDISVIAPDGFDLVRINLIDFIPEIDQPILVGRSVSLNLRLLFAEVLWQGDTVHVHLTGEDIPQVESSDTHKPLDPTRDILTEYSEFPAAADGTVLTRENYAESTPKPVFRMRRFTKGDYDDMLQMLELGLSD